MNSLAVRARSFELSTKDPLKAQERTLLKFLARNKNTEYGRKYNFSSMRSIADFRKKVPISDYKTIAPLIERMKKGENNIITRDKIVFFGITSGTTGDPKLIPVTRYSRERKADAMSIWAYYTSREHPHVFDGKILGIISPEVKNYTEGGIPYGPEDGHAYNNLPDIVKRLYVLPYELFYINDYDARYYAMLRISMEQKVTTIATLNPSTLTLLCKKIAPLSDRIINDIEEGTLGEEFKIPKDIRIIIENKLKPNPKRAKELARILKTKGELLPKYFWPDLELIECWKGGTVKLYLKELPRYFGDVAIRDFGCLSTEARSSIPLSDTGANGVLAINTNFYEFIPKEDIDKKDKRTFLSTELEKGKEYLLIVTTPGGLYRYNIDDVVKVTGYFNATPMIEFMQKGHNAVSLTGEKIYEQHVIEAVKRASDKCGVDIASFCAYAETGDEPRYVFLAEPEKSFPLKDKKCFLECVEEELRIENSEYDDLRKQDLLKTPVLRLVKKGEFDRYRRERVSKGAHDTQFKMPKLSAILDFGKNFVIEEEITI